MRHESHETVIGIVRRHVIEWRKREGWSRETIAQTIVEAHQRMNGPQTTGITFENTTTDAFQLQKNRADKIFRWLDDETKDTNFLPANFIQSVLEAMPFDVRLACVDDILRPIGLATRRIDGADDQSIDMQADLRRVLKEDSESHQAIVGVMAARSPESIATAIRELNESIEQKVEVRRHLETEQLRLSGLSNGGAA